MVSIASGPRPARLEKEELTDTIRELAQRIEQLEAKAVDRGDEAMSLAFSDDKLATIASSIYRSRQMRSRYFEGSLLGDPAWDMLLDLFISKIQGRRVSTSSLCLAAHVPQATGLRWIDQLRRGGLLQQAPAHDDARVKLVEISSEGFRRMRAFIADSVSRFNMPMPD